MAYAVSRKRYLNWRRFPGEASPGACWVSNPLVVAAASGCFFPLGSLSCPYLLQGCTLRVWSVIAVLLVQVPETSCAHQRVRRSRSRQRHTAHVKGEVVAHRGPNFGDERPKEMAIFSSCKSFFVPLPYGVSFHFGLSRTIIYSLYPSRVASRCFPPNSSS